MDCFIPGTNDQERVFHEGSGIVRAMHYPDTAKKDQGITAVKSFYTDVLLTVALSSQH
jgi:hypothetical protein